MSTAILRKHWMELRRLWVFLTAFLLVPGIVVAFAPPGRRGPHHPDVGAFVLLYLVVVLGFLPTRFGGTGLETFQGGTAAPGAGPSLLFTLSLPIRRRTLFFYRSFSGLLAMETVAAAGWAIDALLLVHSGASWDALVPVLWVLPALVPFYFLGSLLLTRFTQISTVQVRVLIFLALYFALEWLGAPFLKRADIALHHLSALPVALAVCLLSAVFAAATVWRLDRQSC